MAASHRLAIAKATFSAALLRPDEACAPLKGDDVARFHNSLEATVLRCSPSNVEKCKTWLNDNVLPSPARIAAFGKFLNSISASYGFEVQASKTPKKLNEKVPSCQRKRLHLLFLVNDVLHQTTFGSAATRDGKLSFADSFRPTIVDLVKDAASFDRNTNQRHHDRLDRLLKLWQEKAYFDSNFGADLESVMTSEGKTVPTRARDGIRTDDASTRDSKTEDWILPAQHGDHDTPWYDLPAACWLPPIRALVEYREDHPKRRRKGLYPHDIKPLQFTPRRVDPKLAKAVQQLIRDADRIYNTSLDDEESVKADFDRMGQKVIIRKIKKGEDGQKVRLISGETYYGWTRDFAEEMYKARKEARARARARREQSGPSEPSDSSRSPSPDAGLSLKRKWDSNGSSPPARAPTGPRRGSPSDSSRPNSSDGRYDPPPAHFNNQFPPPPPMQMQQSYQGYPPPPPPPPPPGISISSGMSIPPPPPTGWSTAWPPAPPPAPQNYQHNQQYQPPPPPPPPPPFHGYQQPWAPPGSSPVPPGMPQMPQYPQSYNMPNQNQGNWTAPAQRGGYQQGSQRGRGNSQWSRGGNRGGYGRGY